MSEILSPRFFLEKAITLPLLDVRAPLEFEKGHIPGAKNIPFLSNEERARVGLTYKQEGRRAAILLGLELVGPRMRNIAESIEEYAGDKRELCLYCARGGMRSENAAWLAELLDYTIFRLEGGYKSFRNDLLKGMEQKQSIIILSGMTGSGKTDVLKVLASQGEQVIDLEGLAHHKGSAFGSMGQAPQLPQQNFENKLGLEWKNLETKRIVWIENESMRIGKNAIPEEIWTQMREAPVIAISMPRHLRVQRLIPEYGSFEVENLEKAIQSISKRLGPQYSKEVIEALHRGEVGECFDLLLEHYYDKAYQYSLKKRSPESIHHVETDSPNPEVNAEKVLSFAKEMFFSDFSEV